MIPFGVENQLSKSTYFAVCPAATACLFFRGQHIAQVHDLGVLPEAVKVIKLPGFGGKQVELTENELLWMELFLIESYKCLLSIV